MGNPKVKKGDIVILKQSRNGYTQWENMPLVVTRERMGSNYINVKSVSGDPSGQVSLHYDGPADDFTLADRKEQAKFLRERNKELETEIERNKQEIIRLEKFETEEDFVAYKLQKILKAKGPKQIAGILKTLKESNYL